MPERKKKVVQPYLLEEKRPEHRLRLRFEIDSEIRAEGLKLALEDAAQTELFWNGERVSAKPDGWYVDEAIETVPLPPLHPGRNVLELRLPFGERTNTEWCYLLGDFGVRVEGAVKTCLLYTSNLLDHIAEEKNVGQEQLRKYDERPRNKLFSRTVRGYSNSMQENVANMQFDFLKRKAASGESFVVVGRCAETVLKGYDGLISIFVLGEKDAKLKRIKKLYRLSEEDARHLIDREDWQRKSYHNYYCKCKWGDSRNYDLSINSSRLGIERTVDMLETYIRARIETEE